MMLRRLVWRLFGFTFPEVTVQTQKIRDFLNDPKNTDRMKYDYLKLITNDLLAITDLAYLFTQGAYTSRDYIELKAAIGKLQAVIEGKA